METGKLKLRNVALSISLSCLLLMAAFVFHGYRERRVATAPRVSPPSGARFVRHRINFLESAIPEGERHRMAAIAASRRALRERKMREASAVKHSIPAKPVTDIALVAPVDFASRAGVGAVKGLELAASNEKLHLGMSPEQ